MNRWPDQRLSPPDPTTYDRRQKEVSDAIASGPRDAVRGPLAIWLHRPELAARAQDLGRYASAKAAVIHFSKVTAVEFAPKGIRVNTVVPGQLHTPMVETRLAGQRAGGDVDALLQSRIRRIPLGWMGDGRDTANAALFLCSDEARFITGTEIVVDGGMSARCD